MLDTLIQIGTLARVGQSEWDALIFKPQTDVKTDQTAAKTDQYLIYFLEFDLDALTMRPEVKATYNEERVNLYRNLQVKGGNNSAYYTTVHTPKHFEQLSKTLFGKKPKIGEKIPTKGEFLDLIEKENPALRETMLAKALEKIFELKELFQTTFAEGDKSAALKVSATEKMHLLVAAVKWAAEGIEVCYQSSIPSGLKIHFYRFNFLIIKKYPNMSMILKNNSDFLFLYEAIQCNPNGDPDQENRPRMDTDTETNLVTDTRIKRYIRDFLKMQGIEIFVDMEGTTKVSSDRKLEVVIKRLLENEAGLSNILTPEFMTKWADIKKESKAKDVPTIIKFMKDKKNKALCSDLNLFLLAYIVKQQFIDIRLFGSAFAIEGFNRSYIGPVQLNWGYSLHKVKLMESNSIVTIMNDDNSTFGKDYRVHYSLLAFNGTVNRFAAQHTGLTPADLDLFRNALWQAIPALPTRSKLNQYPQLYVELVYNDGFFNGHFGDLRQYVKVVPNQNEHGQNLKAQEIRSNQDFKLDTTGLEKLILANRGEGKVIHKAIVRNAANITLSI